MSAAITKTTMNKLPEICTLLLVCCVFVGEMRAQVTFERLLNASNEPQNWLTYSGDYAGRRFSTLDQVNKAKCTFTDCKVGLPDRRYRKV